MSYLFKIDVKLLAGKENKNKINNNLLCYDIW